VSSPENWQWTWAIIAVFFFVCEILTPGSFVCMTLGIGAVAAAFAAAFGMRTEVQWGTFAFVAVFSLFAVRGLTRKMDRKRDPFPGEGVGANRLYGRLGIVTEEIPGKPEGFGMVKIGSQLWRGRSEGWQRVAEGETVGVVDVEGVTLIVRPVSSDHENTLPFFSFQEEKEH